MEPELCLRVVWDFEVAVEARDGRVVLKTNVEPPAKIFEHLIQPRGKSGVVGYAQVGRETARELDLTGVEDDNGDLAGMVHTLEIDAADAVVIFDAKDIDDLTEREPAAEPPAMADDEISQEREGGVDGWGVEVCKADGIE